MSIEGERARRFIVGALAFVVPCAGIAITRGWAAGATGDAAGRALAETADELAEPAELEDSDDTGPSPSELAELSRASPIDIPRGVVEHVALAATPRPQGRVGSARKPEPVLGILVRSRDVRAAISRGGRPSGSSIGASGSRPAGLILQGVSGYGTALRDGDILTRVGGTEATSEGRVIAAVSGAVRSGARAIDGEVWRAGRRIPFVVEIPRGARRR